ncbi:MAG: hypothetical protein AAF721_39545 [Myxococcota bacterium]
MIIACPECSGPFEVADGQIAALVQVECPHCQFAMILDFAAANDPSLVEAGMKMASGFRSAGDYRAAVAGPAARPRLEVAEAPAETQPEAPAAEVAQAAGDGLAADEPADEAPAADEPANEPAAAEPAADPDDFDDGPTMISAPAHRPPSQPAPAPATSKQPEPPANKPARGQTVVGPAPAPPKGETVIGPPPEPPKGMTVTPDASMEAEEEVTKIRTVQDRPSADEARKAPHTPTQAPAAKTRPPTKREDEGSKRVEITHKPARSRPAPDEDAPTRQAERKRPRFESQLPDIEEAPPSSALGMTVVVLLALLAVGLVGASVMQENTPDPRPLLEKLYRQYLK